MPMKYHICAILEQNSILFTATYYQLRKRKTKVSDSVVIGSHTMRSGHPILSENLIPFPQDEAQKYHLIIDTHHSTAMVMLTNFRHHFE